MFRAARYGHIADDRIQGYRLGCRHRHPVTSAPQTRLDALEGCRWTTRHRFVHIS
jgi:hypothetical protein